MLDLFSGAGGLSLGAHLAGFRSAIAVDIDHDLTSSHELNFPRTRTLLADIATLDPAVVLKAAGLAPEALTGIIGGPPCQGFSVIGKRVAGDPRNALVSHFFRFVRTLRPAFFLMENVPGILLEGAREILDAGVESLDAGYRIVGPIVLNAADFGAATNRKRAILIGFRPELMGELSADDILAAQRPAATVADAIADLPGPAAAVVDERGEAWIDYNASSGRSARPQPSAYARRLREYPTAYLASRDSRSTFTLGRVSGFQATQHSSEVLTRFRRLEPGRRDPVSKFPRLRWDAPSPTLRAGTGSDRGGFQSVRPVHPTEHRVITVREAARLQGFPDWFQLHPSRWHSFRMIGNSVSPPMAAAILRVIWGKLNVAR